jgi:hypothetical protein
MPEQKEGVNYTITRWDVVPSTEGGPRIFIAGNITDTEVPGESEYAEFWVSAAMVATLPEDTAGQRAALNPWLKERVDARHLLWRERLATAPPAPEAVPLEEVARIIGDPDDPTPRLKIDKRETHHAKGTRPQRDAADAAQPGELAPRPPRRFSATGRPRAEDDQQPAQAAAPAATAATTTAMNPAAPTAQGGGSHAKVK